MSAMSPERQRGFSIAAAIFLIVILAGLGAAILVVASVQHTSSAIDVQGARAYQAARAGVEWGMFRVMDPYNTIAPGSSAFPPCPAATLTLGGSLSTFNTTVTCASTTASELNRNILVYSITSTAKFGVAGTAGYVERQITVTVSRCKDPSGTAPRFACP